MTILLAMEPGTCSKFLTATFTRSVVILIVATLHWCFTALLAANFTNDNLPNLAGTFGLGQFDLFMILFCKQTNEGQIRCAIHCLLVCMHGMGGSVSGNFYRLQTKSREGNVFTPVCDSLCSQGCVSQHAMGRSTRLCRHPPQGTPPGQTLRDRHPLHRHLPGMATEMGSTHPTGMHSCL